MKSVFIVHWTGTNGIERKHPENVSFTSIMKLNAYTNRLSANAKVKSFTLTPA